MTEREHKGVVLPGIVVSEARGDMFTIEVRLPSGATRVVLAKRSGRLFKHHIRLLPGDAVEVELSPYDLTRGRVITRERVERKASA